MSIYPSTTCYYLYLIVSRLKIEGVNGKLGKITSPDMYHALMKVKNNGKPK